MFDSILKQIGMLEKIDPPEMLYIFLHIQKCAGRTIVTHALNQFGEKKVFHDGMFTAQLHREYGADPGPRMLILTASKDEPFMKKQWFDDTLRNVLPEQKRKSIVLIGGHRTYCGMHKLFNKPVRYFTFLREPVSRIISWYNNVLRASFEHQKIFKAVRDDGQKVPFEEWLETINLAAYSMTAFLSLKLKGENMFDFDFVPSRQDFEHTKKSLKNMYFVGLTENDNDKDFIYQRLGITRFIPNQNVGKEQSTYFIPKDYESARKIILSKCPFDQELYEYAKELNQTMRKQIKDYNRAILYTRFRRSLLNKRLRVC